MYNKVWFFRIWFYSDEECIRHLPLLYFREVLQQGIKAIVSLLAYVWQKVLLTAVVPKS